MAEEVQQGARQHEHPGQRLEQMGSVLGEQEVPRDEREAEKRQTPAGRRCHGATPIGGGSSFYYVVFWIV